MIAQNLFRALPDITTVRLFPPTDLQVVHSGGNDDDDSEVFSDPEWPHISLVYELVYPESCRIVKRQGYLDRLMNFESKNPHTRKQFEHIRKRMREYLAEI